MNFLKEYKKRIIWILCTAAVLIGCALWLFFTYPTNGSPAGGGSSSPIISSPDDADAPGGGGQRFAELNKIMIRLNNRMITYDHMPQTVTRASSMEEGVIYTAGRTGFSRVFIDPSFTDVEKCDQEELILYLSAYEKTVLIDSGKKEEDDGYFLLPAERSADYIVYSRETVSRLIGELFGTEDYVVRCDAYDPETETYTVPNYGIGGTHPAYYGDTLQWTSDDAYICTFYTYIPYGEETAHRGDWEEKYEFHMRRSKSDPDRFYVEKITRETREGDSPKL